MKLIINKKRGKSSRKYYHASDSYDRSRALTKARGSLGPFGLPLSLAVTSQNEPDPVRAENNFSAENLYHKLNQLPHDDINIFEDFSPKKFLKRVQNILILAEDENETFFDGTAPFPKSARRNRNSVKVQETLQKDSLHHQLRSFTITSSGGPQFELLQLCITHPEKIPIFQKSFMRGSGRKRRSHQNLTSTVFSERSATLIWLTMDATTILLVSDGAFSLPELYRKFITDLHLTIAKVQEQAGVWDAEMGPRLQNAVKYCQHQQALLKKLEEVPFLITSPETYSFLELFLSIKSKLIHIVLPSLQSSDAAVTESTFESQDNSVFSSLDDIFEKWEDFLSSLKISRHRRVSPTNLSEELYKPRACTLVRIFSSPWFPHGL